MSSLSQVEPYKDGKTTITIALGPKNSKAQEAASKSMKGHHKKVPQSFTQVIDQLLEVVLHSRTPEKDETQLVSPTTMEVEDANCRDKGKAKCNENSERQWRGQHNTSFGLEGGHTNMYSLMMIILECFL